MTENCPQVTVFNFFVIKWSLSIHFFIELDLAKGMAHTKITFFKDSPKLHLGAACGFGMICFILKICLIQNIFHKTYISAYIFYGFLEICYVLFDVGLLFDKLSLTMFKNKLGK